MRGPPYVIKHASCSRSAFYKVGTPLVLRWLPFLAFHAASHVASLLLPGRGANLRHVGPYQAAGLEPWLV